MPGARPGPPRGSRTRPGRHRPRPGARGAGRASRTASRRAGSGSGWSRSVRRRAGAERLRRSVRTRFWSRSRHFSSGVRRPVADPTCRARAAGTQANRPPARRRRRERSASSYQAKNDPANPPARSKSAAPEDGGRTGDAGDRERRRVGRRRRRAVPELDRLAAPVPADPEPVDEPPLGVEDDALDGREARVGLERRDAGGEVARFEDGVVVDEGDVRKGLHPGVDGPGVRGGGEAPVRPEGQDEDAVPGGEPPKLARLGAVVDDEDPRRPLPVERVEAGIEERAPVPVHDDDPGGKPLHPADYRGRRRIRLPCWHETSSARTSPRCPTSSGTGPSTPGPSRAGESWTPSAAGSSPPSRR